MRQFYTPLLTVLGPPFIDGARLAQSVEHETLNLGVVGSSPTLGEYFESWIRSLLVVFPSIIRNTASHSLCVDD